MARRKSRKSRTRRTTPKINILNVAESALIANAVTEGLFNSNLKDFLMGTKDGAYKAGADGAERLTLPEILGLGKNIALGGNYGGHKTYSSFSATVMENAKKNLPTMAFSLITIPIGFTVASKLTKKPRASTNKLLKMTGLGVKV